MMGLCQGMYLRRWKLVSCKLHFAWIIDESRKAQQGKSLSQTVLELTNLMRQIDQRNILHKRKIYSHGIG